MSQARLNVSVTFPDNRLKLMTATFIGQPTPCSRATRRTENMSCVLPHSANAATKLGDIVQTCATVLRQLNLQAIKAGHDVIGQSRIDFAIVNFA